MSVLTTREPLADSAALREWAADRVRFDRGTPRWLIVEDSGRCWLVHREAPPKFSRDRRPRETWQEITRGLYDLLAPRWPRQRNQGLSYLTPAGIADLLGQGVIARAEGKRRRGLDEARSYRRAALERDAERAFERAEGVPAIERGRRAREWMRTPLPQLRGRTPDDAAAENDEGLAAALFALEGVGQRGESAAELT